MDKLFYDQEGSDGDVAYGRQDRSTVLLSLKGYPRDSEWLEGGKCSRPNHGFSEDGRVLTPGSLPMSS